MLSEIAAEMPVPSATECRSYCRRPQTIRRSRTHCRFLGFTPTHRRLWNRHTVVPGMLSFQVMESVSLQETRTTRDTEAEAR